MALPPADEFAAFLAVAEERSFTRAAERLAMTKSSVGKAVQRLEARLGTALLTRTTRVVRLTADGETYRAAAEVAIEGLEAAAGALAARRLAPTGRVRIDVPAGFGRLLLPALAALRERYPAVTVELSLSDRRSDAVGDGWDLVVRIGELPADGDLTVRKLAQLRLGLYASPAYLAAKGAPRSVDDLRDHAAIMFRAGSGKTRLWRVGSTELRPQAALLCSDGRAVVDAAIAGLGLAQIFSLVAAPHLAIGELERVMPTDDVDGPPVFALIPAGRDMPAKTKVVLEAISRALSMLD